MLFRPVAAMTLLHHQRENNSVFLFQNRIFINSMKLFFMLKNDMKKTFLYNPLFSRMKLHSVFIQQSF